jgi:hypothetical protein
VNRIFTIAEVIEFYKYDVKENDWIGYIGLDEICQWNGDGYGHSISSYIKHANDRTPHVSAIGANVLERVSNDGRSHHFGEQSTGTNNNNPNTNSIGNDILRQYPRACGITQKMGIGREKVVLFRWTDPSWETYASYYISSSSSSNSRIDVTKAPRGGIMARQKFKHAEIDFVDMRVKIPISIDRLMLGLATCEHIGPIVYTYTFALMESILSLQSEYTHSSTNMQQNIRVPLQPHNPMQAYNYYTSRRNTDSTIDIGLKCSEVPHCDKAG